MAEHNRQSTLKSPQFGDTRATVLITLIDLAGKITYASASYQVLLGYDPSSLYGRLLADLIHPDDVANGKIGISPSDLANAEIRTMLVRFSCTDGAWRSMELTAELVGSRDAPGMILIAHDLIASGAAEEQWRNIEQLERARCLTRKLAHDLNNLLTGIGGFVSLSLQLLPPEHSVRRDLEEIQKATMRAAILTRQLRLISREKTMPQSLHLNDLLFKIAPYLWQLIGVNIELITLLAPDLGWIWADPAEIEQVIVSLVVHASATLSSGGKIVVKTANAVGTAEFAHMPVQIEPDNYIMLAVSAGSRRDTSTQACRYEHDRVNEAGDLATEKELSMYAGIIKQLGGFIRVDNDAGWEMSITVYLPRVG